MTLHTSKLKHEILKDKTSSGNKCAFELPELLLICKILATLPEEYFSFKSSWMLMLKSNRTIDNLTSQLWAHKKALSRTLDTGQVKEILTAERNKAKKTFICNYCKSPGHKVFQCVKWKADGKRPKKNTTKKVNSSMKMTLSAETSALVTNCDSKNEDSFLDNGATSHITNRKDLYETFEKCN